MPNQPALDDFDHRLLDLLQRDAGQTLAMLGEKVGLSPSAVQRRIKRYRAEGLLREVAVLDPARFPTTLAVVTVAMERESARAHAALAARLRAAPEVQQCFVLAGDWDYLLVLAARDVAHCREIADRLFLDQDYVKRYETRLVFEVIKQSLQLPTLTPPRRRR